MVFHCSCNESLVFVVYFYLKLPLDAAVRLYFAICKVFRRNVVILLQKLSIKLYNFKIFIAG